MIYYETDYLAHHGVKGMKWGVRKQKQAIGDARYQYRQDLKDARKAARKQGFIVKNPSDPRVKAYKKATEKAQNSELKYIREKAKLAKMKRGEKGEFNVYRSAMSKTGAPGSIADVGSGGRSTRIYNDLKKRKGKAYADKAFTKTKNYALTAAAVSTAAAIGIAIVGSRLS